MSVKIKDKHFYVCSYGGCGSKMLYNYLNNFGKTYHVHSRYLPEKLTHIKNEHFTNTLVENNIENYYVIYIYRNPVDAILSRFSNPNHLRHIQCKGSIKLDDVINTKQDLYNLDEFFTNYTSINSKRNYKIYCIKYEEFFENIKTFNIELGIDNNPKFYPVKKEREKECPNYIALKNIYSDLINKMNNMSYITII